jgi:hypothetical protein
VLIVRSGLGEIAMQYAGLFLFATNIFPLFRCFAARESWSMSIVRPRGERFMECEASSQQQSPHTTDAVMGTNLWISKTSGCLPPLPVASCTHCTGFGTGQQWGRPKSALRKTYSTLIFSACMCARLLKLLHLLDKIRLSHIMARES